MREALDDGETFVTKISPWASGYGTIRPMKGSRTMIAIAALVVSAAVNANEAVVPVSAMAGPIEVRVDPNFELIAMVCNLAGYEEYSLSLFKEQDRKLIKDRFGSLTNHPAVKAFKNYRKK